MEAMSRLTEALRRVTADEARAVTGTTFAWRLVRGELGRADYVRLLGCLQALYAELEWGLLWNRRHPDLASLELPAPEHNLLLQEDLRALLGPDWYASAPRQAAGLQVERLGVLCEEAPGLLAAHAWVLYATQLPGAGQPGPPLARGLGLRGDEGTRFLRHATHLDSAQPRAWLLASLDEVAWGPETREAFLHEAWRCVRGLRVLFERLDQEPPRAPGPRERPWAGRMRVLPPMREAC